MATSTSPSILRFDKSNGSSEGEGDEDIIGSILPKTGFPIGKTTVLPRKAANLAYPNTGLTLYIPSLDVNAAIDGIPKSGDSWDVSWLGKSAGYLYGSAFPTRVGNTVNTCHTWDVSNIPCIFVELKSDIQICLAAAKVI